MQCDPAKMGQLGVPFQNLHFWQEVKYCMHKFVRRSIGHTAGYHRKEPTDEDEELHPDPDRFLQCSLPYGWTTLFIYMDALVQATFCISPIPQKCIRSMKCLFSLEVLNCLELHLINRDNPLGLSLA